MPLRMTGLALGRRVSLERTRNGRYVSTSRVVAVAALIVVSGNRTWELYPDAAGYLGGVRRGKNESVMFVRDIDKLALPADIERELRVFHELATGDSGGTDAEYA